ncbi:MAG: hypothetical protein IT369_13630, partial [Candidatus Latescibacteria bacterium]|nr:hypothetical protein [Candidatus Latescibacterota bacterium]
SYSNYARQAYQRYVSTALEGEHFYDTFGNFLTRGWLIYGWQEETPQPFGSSVFKGGQFSNWFNRLVIASDHQGQYHYALTIGDQIRTTLTPLTFSKPKFNGLQWDFAADKYEATLLLSRISAPNPEIVASSRTGGDQRTDVTNLVGGRLVAQVGDFAKVGGTFLSAYQANTQSGSLGGNVFKGQLSGPQNFANVRQIEVRIGDDSPEDGEDGGALFSADLLIWDLHGAQIRASQIGFRPQTEGGFQRQGFLSADGHEQILLRFDFDDRTYLGPDPDEIGRVQVELVIANDYLIEVSSDRQEGTFLPVAQAPGNIKDSSNQRVLSFDYGLPTANQLLGFTLEVAGFHGVQAYAELDLNSQYRQYPNLSLDEHYTARTRATAGLFNLSWNAYPFFAFGEGFRTAANYTTSMPLLDRDGNPNYTQSLWRYEFVEDNDDQDQYPDWLRRGGGELDLEVFPGWDENNDFVSDFNQNDNRNSPNLVPDYEEPFLRFSVDRPEYLYGMDMNHNQWIDRFENDEEPDYPYPRDRQGYNAYGGAFLDPDTKLNLGRQRLRQLVARRYSRDTYLLLTLDKDHPSVGRVRVFEDLHRVEDDIPENLLQWVQEANTRGTQRFIRDALPAQNTWINTTWVGWDWKRPSGLSLAHKLKWQLYRQLGSDEEVELRQMRRQGTFFGAIGKAEYRLQVKRLTWIPRWKSEFRHEVPVQLGQPRRQELSELFALLLRLPLLQHSSLESGLEYHWFTQLRRPTPLGEEDTDHSLVLATQLSNVSDYQGYLVTTIVGFQLGRRWAKDQEPQTRTQGFVTVYAGMER